MQYSFSYYSLSLMFAIFAGTTYYNSLVHQSIYSKIVLFTTIWFAFVFFLLGLIYSFNMATPLGKTAKGGRWYWAWLLFGPYFFLSWLALFLWRFRDRKSAYVELAPKVYLGRKLNEREADAAIKKHGIKTVIDMAVELAETEPFRELNYVSIPVLDGMPPTVEQMNQALKIIESETKNGSVYLHCAYGHGRSCTVAVAHLLQLNLANDVINATAQIRRIRKGIKLSPAQRAVVLQATGRAM